MQWSKAGGTAAPPTTTPDTGKRPVPSHIAAHGVQDDVEGGTRIAGIGAESAKHTANQPIDHEEEPRRNGHHRTP